MTSAQSAHNLQKFDKNSDTLMTINSKTRPICPDKKFLAHLCQKKRDAATRISYKVCG